MEVIECSITRITKKCTMAHDSCNYRKRLICLHKTQSRGNPSRCWNHRINYGWNGIPSLGRLKEKIDILIHGNGTIDPAIGVHVTPFRVVNGLLHLSNSLRMSNAHHSLRLDFFRWFILQVSQIRQIKALFLLIYAWMGLLRPHCLHALQLAKECPDVSLGWERMNRTKKKMEVKGNGSP